MNRPKTQRLTRPADALLPAVLLIATCLGRDAIAFDFFLAFMLARLCALATAPGLRIAFAGQPSIRATQGSVLAALIAQAVGAALALPIFPANHPHRLLLIACGLLINIEHVFYEYMYAVGDGDSAALSRSITALLVLTGLLLDCPPWRGMGDPSGYSVLYLLVAAGLAALASVAVGLCAGGRFRPKLNGEVLRRAPTAMLQTALFPGLAVLILMLAELDVRTYMPLWAGLILSELCRTPFRRTPAEARPLNRALLIVGGLCLLGLIPFLLGFRFASDSRLLNDVPYTLAGILLAAACAFTLYGNTHKRNMYE